MVVVTPRPRRPLPERAVIIQSGEIALEGLYIKKDSPFLPAVLNAPHPQFGGSMDSPFLNEIAYALSRSEVASLRYNYRGVGGSQGTYEGGLGERKDMTAAIEFLTETFYPEGQGPVVVAGYSFGSWIAFEEAKRDRRIERLLLVAPPIHKYDFSSLPELKTPLAILVGSKDTFCPVGDLQAFLKALEDKHSKWSAPPVFVVPHASHYFVRGLSEAGQAGAHFLKTGEFPQLAEE